MDGDQDNDDLTPADVDAGGENPSSGVCETAPPPVSPPGNPGGPPSQPGCYVLRDGVWQRIPCNCELPLKNTSASEAQVQLTLVVSPSDVLPVLSGSPDVEISFPDQDSAWYDTWARETGNGTDFAVTHLNGATVVRLGTASVTLGPVPLGACEARMGKATVTGMPWSKLDMQASVRDGTGVTVTIVGSCVNIPHP